jgi:hypothetical protein
MCGSWLGIMYIHGNKRQDDFYFLFFTSFLIGRLRHFLHVHCCSPPVGPRITADGRHRLTIFQVLCTNLPTLAGFDLMTHKFLFACGDEWYRVLVSIIIIIR